MTQTLGAPATVNVEPIPWWLRGGHLETIVPSVFAPPLPAIASERRLVEVEPGTSLETWYSRPSSDKPRGTVLIIHGLGGSADRPHVRATAAEAVTRGWHAVRVNLRNHGGTAHLASTLFNAAQSDDIGRLLEAFEAWNLPRPYAVLAVSLGANTALRYAALAGSDCRADAIGTLNPAIDFFRIEEAIDRPSNILYRYNFVIALCRLIGEIRRHREVPGPAASPWRISTVRQFDALFTAPGGGFASVDAYYTEASAGPMLDQVRVPTLLLTAANDPFVPADTVTRRHGVAGGLVEARLADRGGHVGYRIRGPEGRPAFWGATALLEWVESTLHV